MNLYNLKNETASLNKKEELILVTFNIKIKTMFL